MRVYLYKSSPVSRLLLECRGVVPLPGFIHTSAPAVVGTSALLGTMRPVTAFTLPLVIRVPDDGPHREFAIDLQVSGPALWGSVVAAVRAAAGLAPSARIYLGVGQVEDDWVVGAPPLLAGMTLSTAPIDELPVAATLTLSVVAGPDAGAGVPFGVDPVTVGRSADNDLVIEDPRLSAHHARIAPTTTGLSITDLGSTNGIRVEGGPLPAGGVVPQGSMIRMGGSLLRVGLVAESPAQATPDGRGHLIVSGTPPSTPPLRPYPSPPMGPSDGDRRPLPLVTAVISAAVGATLAIALHSWVYLAIAAVGPLTMFASAMGDRAAGRRRRGRAQREHREAMHAWSVTAGVVAIQRRDAEWQRYPDPSTLLRRALTVRASLWSRSRADPLRWCLALGVEPRAGPPIPIVPAGRVDEQLALTRGLPGPARPAPETPVVVDLGRSGVLGLIGAGGPLLRWLLMQALCLLPPGDLRIVIFSTDPDLQRCRDGPHGVGTADTALTAGTDLLVVIDDAVRWRLDPTVASLLDLAVRTTDPGPPRILALCTAGCRTDLPAGCSSVVEVGAGITGHNADSATLIDDVGDRRRFEPTGVSNATFRRVITALIPLVDRGGATRLPDALRFSDLVDPIDADELRRRWSDPTVAATIGSGLSGPVTLDLDRDGPHLLVAGTTGAGKSELLQTFVAALAVAAPPDRLSFLLIDYKGGAAFAGLAGLPHVAGMVTDLDAPLAARALTSLRAELRRRERLAAGGVGSAARLVIVVDEFAALAADQPEFLAGLVDVAQRGRSLGLHLVLATQRPAGVVSPAIRANTAMRICLRVTDPVDSTDIVGTPAAAAIPASVPGRALLWTGGRPPAAFQTARVTAPIGPGILARLRGTSPVAPSSFAGPTELDLLISAAKDVAGSMPRVPPPWLPPLPSRIDHDRIPQVCVALIDRPELQRQDAMALPDGSVLVVGGPRSGRTTTLARIAAAASASGTRLAIIDPQGSLTAGWRWLAAADTVLDGSDPVLVGRLLDALTDLPGGSLGAEPILLMIDGWEDVTASLDAADQGVTTSRLCRLFDGAPSRLRIAATGGPALRHHGLAQRATVLIELGDEPDRLPGRGRCRGEALQVVLPPDRQPLADAGCTSTGSDVRRIVIRPLPTTVRVSDLPASRVNAVPIGIGGDLAGPVTLDLGGPGGVWVVAGPHRSGVSTVLVTMALGAVAAGIPTLWAGREMSSGSRPGRQFEDAHLLHEALAGHRGPLIVFADDVATSASTGLTGPDGSGREPSEGAALNAVLSRFCQVCGPGQTLVIGTRPEALAAAFHGPVAEAIAFRRAILLGPDPGAAGRFGVRLPRRAGPAPPGRGHLLRDGDVIPLQVALPPPAPLPAPGPNPHTFPGP